MIKVDPASFIPIYEQIKKEIFRLVAAGLWRVHDPLPSIRDLAAELLVNPNTVARAYRELEQEGLISTQKGKGSVVAARQGTGDGKIVRTHLSRIFDEAIAEARTFSLNPEDIMKLFEERLNRRVDKGKGGGHHD